MIQRFDSDVAHEKPEVVVIWGGLNDLAAGQTPQGVVENLIRLSGRCSEIGCFPILCSLTHGIEPSLINRRINETNELLRRHCDSNNVTFADLTSVLSDNDGRLRLEYSDDGVHLNEWGYSEVAKVIFSGIVPFLEERLRD
jgi:lysophospholipase L1-like esterase